MAGPCSGQFLPLHQLERIVNSLAIRPRRFEGYRRGTDAAALESAGAAVGSAGLAAFALAVWMLTPDFGLASLVVASIAWLLVSVSGWRLWRRLGRSR
jgi:hypothetical protein